MSSRTRKTLVITAPDGTDVTEVTAGDYSVAGIIQGEDGRWRIVAHGYAHNSVANRTRAMYNRGSYRTMHTGLLREVTAPVIRDYFGTHAVTVDKVFRSTLPPDQQDSMLSPGWIMACDAGYVPENTTMAAGRSILRMLAKDGWEAVSIYAGGRLADFQMSEILKSMNARKG